MNIPDKAVEAVAQSNFEQINGHLWDNQPGPSKDAWRRYARRTLESAAPFIAAQAQVYILEVMRNSSQKVHDEVAGNDPNATIKRIANAYVVKLCDAYILDLEDTR